MLHIYPLFTILKYDFEQQSTANQFHASLSTSYICTKSCKILLTWIPNIFNSTTFHRVNNTCYKYLKANKYTPKYILLTLNVLLTPCNVV